MSVYSTTYTTLYGDFPLVPIGIETDLYLGSWQSMTSYVYQRNAMQITRGRQSESATITPSSCTMTLNNRDGRFSIRNPNGAWYGELRQNTPFRLSVPNALTGGGTYLRMEDDQVSNASCPDSTALHITGTLDVRIDCQLSGYNGGQSLIGKATVAAPAWELILNGDGTVTLYWWTTGAAIQSAQSTAPVPYLGRIMIRAVLNTSSEYAEFWTAPDMAGSQTQLGSTVSTGSTSLTAGSGTDVYVGCSYSPGANGQFYEAQIYSGIGGSGGTLVAGPQFYNQTAGATSFTDGQSNTWTMNGTAELSNRLYRFHGEMSSFPQAADPTGTDVYSSATASGILRRLTQQQNPTNSAMYRAYLRLPSDLQLAAYWPMEDGANATQIASALSGGLPMIFNGSPQLYSNSDFVCSDDLPAVSKAIFTGPVPANSLTWTDNVVRFLMEVPSGGDANGAIIARVHTSGTVRYADLVYGTGGTLTLSGYDQSGTQLFTSGAVAFAVNGELLRVSIELTPSGSGIQYGIATVQPGQEGVYSTATYATASTIGAVTGVILNASGNLTSTVLGHLSVQATDDTIYDVSQPLNAWLGETAGNRYSRLCSEEGYNCRIIGFPDNSVAMGYQTLETIADLLQECETTDMGMQFEPRTCLGLGYVCLNALYNQAVSATAAYSGAQLAAAFSSLADDEFTINDVTITNADSSSARLYLSSGNMSVLSPPDGIGRVDTAITVNAAADSNLINLAGWKLHVATTDDDRYPVLPFDMARPQTPDTIPLLDIGQYMQVTGTPDWIPPSPVKQICAGFTETIGPFAIWTIGVNGVPETPYEVAVTGTAKADTDGSTLQTGVSSTATSLSVATTNSASPLWTTAAGDFPFDIQMAGERITVTGITGSSSPQTFTVTRSVNGVVKAQTAGTPLSLYFPAVAAL